MSEKILDRKGRWRNKIISFRISPEENEILDRMVALCGTTKQAYLISCITNAEIVVEPSPFVIRSLKNELKMLISNPEFYDSEIEEFVLQLLHGFGGNKKIKIKAYNGGHRE